jgi:glycosyltransferase involved in cell wall biosynthesis
MTPLVSVIVPTFNYARYVAQAIESVQQQSLSRWECLVVDDGSTDDTRAIVERLAASDGRVRYLYQHNQGLSAARNTGIRESAGEYLQFLDSDDLLEPRKLEVHASFLAAHPAIDVVYGEMRYFPSDAPGERLFSRTARNRPWMPGISGTGTELVRRLLLDNIMVVNCPLLRRNVVDACGMFDERLRANEDWEYWIRCALKGVRFEHVPAEGTLALVRYHAGSMSRDERRMIDANRQLHRAIEPLLPDEELRSINRQALARADMLEALEAIRRGQRFAGLAALLQHALRSGSFSLVPYGLKLFVAGK